MFNVRTFIIGLLFLAVIAAESIMSTPITGMSIVFWLLILIPVIIASLPMPKTILLVTMFLALAWFGFEVISNVGAQISLFGGLKMFILAIFVISVIPDYMATKK